MIELAGKRRDGQLGQVPSITAPKIEVNSCPAMRFLRGVGGIIYWILIMLVPGLQGRLLMTACRSSHERNTKRNDLCPGSPCPNPLEKKDRAWKIKFVIDNVSNSNLAWGKNH